MLYGRAPDTRLKGLAGASCATALVLVWGAMRASWPAYDANDFGATAARDPSRFMDPAVSSVYEPGSVMKALTSVAALETGTATPSTVFQDEKVLVLDHGVTKVRNANLQSKGALTLTQALAFSRNVVFSKVALGLGATTQSAAERLYQTWERFGIGALRGPKHGGANEVAFEVQKRYDNPDEAEAEVAGGLGMVAGEDAEAAGGDGKGFMEPELGAEIGDRVVEQDRRVLAAPGAGVRHVGRKGVQHPPHARGKVRVLQMHAQLGLGHLVQDGDGVVVKVRPAAGREVVGSSFGTARFEPREAAQWDAAGKRFTRLP